MAHSAARVRASTGPGGMAGWMRTYEGKDSGGKNSIT